MNLKSMPKDTLAELLQYLVEHERFTSIEDIAGNDITVPEVKNAIRELARELAKEAASETKSYDVKNCKVLSKTSKNVISSLSTREEKILLKKFGLIEK